MDNKIKSTMRVKTINTSDHWVYYVESRRILVNLPLGTEMLVKDYSDDIHYEVEKFLTPVPEGFSSGVVVIKKANCCEVKDVE